VCPRCGTRYTDDTKFCPIDGTPLKMSEADDPLVGTVVAERYLVQKRLGQGGMGRVYLALQVLIDRPCALKIIKPAMARDPDMLVRFQREASNAGRVSHPNVASVYDFGSTGDGVVYLAMEYVEGETLSQLVKREGPLPPPRALRVARQIADALHAAHELNIVHRDLKPDNVMITRGRDGTDLVKVVDFGIARIMGSETQQVTGTGLAIGTPEYMSPEQIVAGPIDGRTDIFSLGLVLYRSLTGRLPWEGADAQEAIMQRLGVPRKTLLELMPSVEWPPSLQQVLDRTLAIRAENRYQSAADVAHDLAYVTQTLIPPDVSTPRGFTPPSAPQVEPRVESPVKEPPRAPPPHAAPAPRPRARRPISRRALWRGSAIVLLFAILLPASIQLLGSRAGTGTSAVDPDTPRVSAPPPQADAPPPAATPDRPVVREDPPATNPTRTTPVPSLSPDEVRAELDRLGRVTRDVYNLNRDVARQAIASARRLMPSLTTRLDSVEAQYYMIESHLVGLDQPREACRLLLRIVDDSRGTRFADGVDNMLRNPDLGCRARENEE
jgi:eukaryotic-like serine/threonine-protein kinase